MRGTSGRGAALVIALGFASGCAGTHQARYVYQDGQFGVVGIPRNTSQWPTFYRKQADELMAKHFPLGYEIVRAEEVVEGSRVLTTNGAGGAEVSAGLPLPLLKIGSIGVSSSRNQADSVKIKECRILYKKAESGSPAKADHYAEQPSLSPTTYVDPNALARRQAGETGAKPAQGPPTALADNVPEPPKPKAPPADDPPTD